MSRSINLRTVQAFMALAYGLLAAIAVAREPSLVSAFLAVGMAVGAYLTGRAVPDVHIPATMILRVCGIGAVVLVVGLATDLFGSSHALGWAMAVMGYCAGNRLKAAGVRVPA
ncbi:hypothetical protein [Sphingomonas kyeonggiensis]|uniref:Uncharacterized protein n=1 Tax=Sphingomonas kyeonggiensis TaxID=1268553 RepID=A0A7W6NXM4_9SPHN|nr:hypothetical protein [Sphingomonas kyeonggiensis]MBB4099413.1 hypothetical protein [Sphingomonas kyeonggiensis]